MQRFRSSRALLIAFLVGTLVTTAPLGAQVDDGEGRPGGRFAQQTDDAVVSVTAEFTARAGAPAGELSIAATLEPTWHVYSITQPAGGPLPTEIKLRASEAFRLLGDFRADPPPKTRCEPVFGDLAIETHHDQVIWRAPIEIGPGVNPETLAIEGAIRVQPCNPNNCLPPQEIPFTARLERNVLSSVPPAIAVAPGPSDAQPSAGGEERGRGSTPVVDAKPLKISAHSEVKETPLAMVLGLGFLGGLILNLMPCVLPVIALKILSFVEQAGQSRRQALVLNAWYSVGLLSVFMLLASLPSS